MTHFPNPRAPRTSRRTRASHTSHNSRTPRSLIAAIAAVSCLIAPTLLAAASLAAPASAAPTASAADVPQSNTDCVPAAGAWQTYQPKDSTDLTYVDSSGKSATAKVGYETDHFAFYWTDADEKDPGTTNNTGKLTMDTIKYGAGQLEKDYDLFTDPNGIDFPAPGCASAVKHKIMVIVNHATGLMGGSTNDNYPAMWMMPTNMRDDWGLAHEFTHTLQFATGEFMQDRQWIFEMHANWTAFHATGKTDPHFTDLMVNNPNVHFGSSHFMYYSWQFLEYIAEKYGVGAISKAWWRAFTTPDSPDDNPMQYLREALGLSQTQYNDLIGEYAAHNVTWDYPGTTSDGGKSLQQVFSDYYGDIEDRSVGPAGPLGTFQVRTNRLTYLDQTTDANGKPIAGRYQVLNEQAPEQGGYNVVKLNPDAGATSITVGFHGIRQSKSATSAFPKEGDDGTGWNQPASVPEPASGWRWSVVAIDAAGKARYSAVQSASDGLLTFALKPGDQRLYLVVAGTPSVMQRYLWTQQSYSIYRYPYVVDLAGAKPAGIHDGLTGGHRHANGGGWVADSAKVADSAYVGPNATVYGGVVSGNARIEDHAAVYGGTVSGNAVVKGISVVVGSDTTVTDDAVIDTWFQAVGNPGAGHYYVGGNARLTGTVELLTNQPVTAGSYYGNVDDAALSSGFSKLTGPVAEVTRTPDASDYTTVATLSERADLERVISQYESLDATRYTADSWRVATDAHDAAETLLKDAGASGDDVTAAADRLGTAIKGLVAADGGNGDGGGNQGGSESQGGGGSDQGGSQGNGGSDGGDHASEGGDQSSNGSNDGSQIGENQHDTAADDTASDAAGNADGDKRASASGKPRNSKLSDTGSETATMAIITAALLALSAAAAAEAVRRRRG